MKTDIANRLAAPENLYMHRPTRFQGNSEKKLNRPYKKQLLSAGGHFDYQWKAENLIMSSPYSWATSPLALGMKKLLEGLNVYMNYEFNLLDNVGVVAKGSE